MARTRLTKQGLGTMKIAYGTYAMPETPLEEAIPMLAGMGYEGVEICISPKHIGSTPDEITLSRRETLKGLLREHGMGVPALFVLGHILETSPDAHRANLEHIRRAHQLARDLEIAETPVIAMGIGGRSDDWESLREPIVSCFGDYARLGEEEGFIMAGEAHCGAAVDRSDRALWVVESVASPAGKLHFDIVHMFLSGEAIADSVRKLVPVTAHTHITDAKRHEDGAFDLLLLGQGELDGVAYMKAMDEAGWTSFITLEVSTRVWSREDYDVVEAAKFSYASLTRAFEEAGVART